MTIKMWIDKIKSSISEGKAYDEYKHLFFEYIVFLERTLSKNPENIKAVCQLAIAYMEAWEPAEKSVELMENTLNSFKDKLSSEELTELMTNLAFFYAEEMDDIDKAKHILEEVVMHNPNLPNSYNALGIIYLNDNNVNDALRMLQKASTMSDDIKYHYNYAAALYIDGQLEKATNIFNRISKDWRDNEDARKAYYSYGMARSLKGHLHIGIEVADNLCTLLDKDTDSNPFELADLYYVCKEYGKCIELYEDEELYPSKDWLGLYFYSLYEMDLRKKLRDTFNRIIDKKESDIEEAQEDNDEVWTIEDRRLYAQHIKKDIEDFRDIYDSIINNDYIPSIDFKPDLIYGCYLIDCPRHG